MDVVFDDNIPIYLQIINSLKNEMIIGKLRPGEKLPSVRELSAMLKVNPNTVARVYQELERQDITYTQRGMGTFIREDIDMVKSIKKEMAQTTIDKFLEGMKKLGFTKEDVKKLIEESWNR